MIEEVPVAEEVPSTVTETAQEAEQQDIKADNESESNEKTE